MNCNFVQEELLLWFGRQSQGTIPEELLAHLEKCPDCAAFFEEQQQLASLMPPDELFYPERHEAAVMFQNIEERLDLLDQKRTWWQSFKERWRPVLELRKVVPVAASMVLMLTFGMVAQKAVHDTAPSEIQSMTESDNLLNIFSDPALDQPDEPTVNALLWQVNSSYQTNAGDMLVDDISQEEYDYLLENIDVEDLL
ncbi:MAG TPA: hypothetical protein PLF13_09055 [candidate division Zixibacteria bacterium]|nr:hypothetical protein [candidate division Zixibacteria bacterium]